MTNRTRREDDSEMLDERWLGQFCKKAACRGGVIMMITGTEFELYKKQDGPNFGYGHWSLFKELDNGDEMDICLVQTRGEILNLLSFLVPEGGEWNNVEPERAPA